VRDALRNKQVRMISYTAAEPLTNRNTFLGVFSYSDYTYGGTFKSLQRLTDTDTSGKIIRDKSRRQRENARLKRLGKKRYLGWFFRTLHWIKTCLPGYVNDVLPGLTVRPWVPTEHQRNWFEIWADVIGTDPEFDDSNEDDKVSREKDEKEKNDDDTKDDKEDDETSTTSGDRHNENKTNKSWWGKLSAGIKIAIIGGAVLLLVLIILLCYFACCAASNEPVLQYGP